MNAQQIQDSLSNFTGTDGYHRITIVPHLVATDGVAWLAENAQCYWLIDEIALAQMHPKVRSNKRLQEIQFWTLKVEGSRGTLICEEDEGKPVYTKAIPFTDFPLSEIRIWVGPGDEKTKVALLPSEY